jgi:hypothetical protein
MLLMPPPCPATVPGHRRLMSPFLPLCPRIPQKLRQKYVSRSAPVARYTDSDRRAGTPPQKRRATISKFSASGRLPPSRCRRQPRLTSTLAADSRVATALLVRFAHAWPGFAVLSACLPVVGRRRSTALRTALHSDTQHDCMLAFPSYPIEPPARSISAQPSPAQTGACRRANRQRRE